MSDIFIHIYLDEDVDVLIANLLRSRGFNATTTTQSGQRGKSDLEQLEFSTSTPWREYPYHFSSLQSLPLVSPFERLGHRVIEIGNEI